MVLVTLIGERLAEEGKEFVYIGPHNDCKSCKLKNVCFNLKKDRKYKIKKVRKKSHSCNVHSGSVSVVEVEELPIVAAIDKKLSEGAKTKVDVDGCKHIGCKHHEICNAPLKKDKKYKINKVFDSIDCPIGKDLKKAELID